MQALDSKDPQHREFWDAMALVAEVELKEAQRQDEADRARLRGEPEPEDRHASELGLHSAVDRDINLLLSGAALLSSERASHMPHRWLMLDLSTSASR